VPLVVAATAAAVVAGLAATSNAGAAPASSKLAPGIATSKLTAAAPNQHASPRVLAKNAPAGEPGSALPAGVPTKGTYAFLIKLGTKTTTAAQNGAKSRGATAAKAAAKSQLAAITSAQNKVISALPSKSHVLYRMHAVLSGVAVTTNVANYAKLTNLSGVTAVYPIAPKSASNSYAVPLQGAPQAWKAYGDRGENATVAILDTGVDYTHSDFGGSGIVDDYTAAKAQLGQPVKPGEFPGPKVVGGYDLVGDAYDPTSADPAISTPAPDPYPLDCNGHGSHVAGTVAGYGENSDGSTYTGAYDTSTAFDTMKIGPGVAPLAKLYAYRVFGCDGSTNVVAEAIDRAADPNGDGDTSDHVDVINMSLGSDYGSPQDGDSVATDAASALGITMVIASGNGGDLYAVGGSPGDAPTALTAAASVDAYSQVDALNVSAPPSIAGPYPAERSVAYDYVTKPDLTGDVVRVTQASNLDGCAPLNATDAAAVAGHIAFVEWTDTDANRRCGSVARSTNLAAAQATGVIFADDSENFGAGITGSTSIPGVLVAKSGGDAIRGELLAGNTVTIGSTTKNGFPQFDEALNDTVASFSSRGIGDAGNVKPDVSAVGASVFSAGSGSGSDGLNDSGTSMATPMTAGTAALLSSKHPEWVPEQIKADIMNTAGQDLFTGTNHTGEKYGPQRVGAGRIDINEAVGNQVLAYNAEDHGSVSASFGPLAVTAPTTLHKDIRVQNTSNTAVTFDVSFTDRTSVPGAVYTVSPSSISIDPRSSKTVTVTLAVDPTKLEKTIDPTMDRVQGGNPREYQADASGIVELTGTGTPTLRVPVYSAPRPASVMTQPASVTMPSSPSQAVFLPLSGQSVNQGSGPTLVQSTVAGFELAATSGLAPSCSATVADGCVHFPDERTSDLKYVGVTSDTQQLNSIGANPTKDGLTYFAVTTQGAWRTAASSHEFDVLIDTTGDGQPDFVAFNTRLTGSDIFVSELVNLTTNKVVDIQAINNRLGDTDTALLNSDTMVLPVANAALGLTAGHSRIRYGVAAFSAYQSGPVDTVGLDNVGNTDGALSFDSLHPGVALYGSFDRDTNQLLYRDSPGSVLKLTRDPAAYLADKGKGLLTVHFQNAVGNKAQVTTLSKATTAASLSLAPHPAKRNKAMSGTVKVTNTSGVVPTGTVTLRRVSGAGAPAVVGTGTLVNGSVKITFTPKTAGTFQYQATYNGSATYGPATSPRVTVKINP
jgi:subtilisin family serine protease